MDSRITQEISFGERLANEAQRARDMAATLPPGKKQDALLEKARLADLGARLNGWLAAALVPAKSVTLRRRSET